MTSSALITMFITLFVIIDPIALAPLFVTLTRGMTTEERHRIAIRAIAIAFGLLTVFALAGETLLDGIGVGLPAFRISGGMLLFLIAVDMLFERRGERRKKRADEKAPDPSVFPLATPLIAGPGALATMILLAGKSPGDPAALAAILGVLIAVLAVTYLAFRAGSLIEQALGSTGVVVVTRLFGILLAAVSVQFVLDGLTDLGLLGR